MAYNPMPGDRVTIEPPGEDPRQEGLRTMALVVYVLYIISPFVGFTSIIGVIIAHIKRSDADRSPIYGSHFRRQISLFWISLLLAIVGWLTTVFLIGWLILAGTFIYFEYYSIKGLLRVSERRPMD